jgi:hypothetical protein
MGISLVRWFIGGSGEFFCEKWKPPQTENWFWFWSGFWVCFFLYVLGVTPNRGLSIKNIETLKALGLCVPL